MKSASLSQKAYSLLMFLAVSVLAGLLISGLAVPFTALTGSAGKMAVTALEDMPAELRTPPQHERSEVYMADGSLLATFADENREYVTLDKISTQMQMAQLAIEDHRFYEHGAIDFQGFGRAAIKTLTGDTQGASTLTQQYVKMVRIEMARASGDEEARRKADEVTIERKIIEARYAMALEEELTKDEILERYLNIAYYGDGAYGVQAAAKQYFGVDAADLNLSQSAMLAGIVQNPTSFAPTSKGKVREQSIKKTTERRDVVLNQMAKWDMITLDEAEEAKTPLDFSKGQRTYIGCANSDYPFICDYVRRTLISDQMTSLGATPEERTNTLERGGLRIHTLIDPAAQNSAQKAVSNMVASTDPVLANSVLIQPSTGLIVAMAQSRPVMGEKEFDQTFYNYNVGASMGGAEGYQAGSTFKTFVLASALNQGATPDKTYNAPGRMQFKGDTFRNCEGPFKFNQDYEPQNQFGKGWGNIDMMRASQNSVNTYFIQLIRDTGICSAIDMAKLAGVERSDGKDMRVDANFPSWVLGVTDVTPLSMAEAYATFANRGIHCEPIILKSVERNDGTAVEVPSANCKQVIRQEVADGVNYILKSVALKGTGRPAALGAGRDEAGKTGTTNGAKAVWYAGYTPEMAGVAMITVDKTNPHFKGTKNPSLTGVRVKGGRLDGSGGGDAGQIWKAAMKSALRDKPKTKFTAPSKSILEGVKVKVPSIKGMGYDEAKQTLEAAGFSTSVWRVYSDRRKGAFLGIEPSGTATKFSTIRMKISNGPKPKPKPKPATPATPNPQAPASIAPPAVKPTPPAVQPTPKR